MRALSWRGAGDAIPRWYVDFFQPGMRLSIRSKYCAKICGTRASREREGEREEGKERAKSREKIGGG
jgi:hypothetical protein